MIFFMKSKQVKWNHHEIPNKNPMKHHEIPPLTKDNPSVTMAATMAREIRMGSG